MSRILFVMLHPGFIRYYEDALYALADAGHQVHVAFETSREKLGESELAARLTARASRITCGTTPPRVESVREFLARGDRTAARSGHEGQPRTAEERREERLESLATTVRLMLDYLRFFEPEFAGAHKLRARAEKRLPRLCAKLIRLAARSGASGRRRVAALLHDVERLIPTPAALEAFLRANDPDLVLVTPLIELGSQQVDYVKAARRLGIRSALCVASWDNLTSKGLIRVVPDHVLVWNEAQKDEAVSLHGVAPDRVIVTGAQNFDWWFTARPGRSREEFCRAVGLDPARPFVLYVGSSIFIAPEEVPFAERWLDALRASPAPLVAAAGVLIRPHPANSRQWRTFDPAAFDNAAVFPSIGTDPNSPQFRRDYFDSLYHCAAVVGINTSAQIEAGILSRPVFTIQAPEFAHSQAGTLHFRHLVDPASGPVRTATSLQEHAAQLASALAGESRDADVNRRFLHRFIRPRGADVPAVPIFVRAVETLGGMPRPLPAADPAWVGAARPLVGVLGSVARVVAEDRPVWVYAARPFVGAGIWAWAGGYAVAAAGRSALRALKPVRRDARRGWHEWSEALRRRRRRANRPLARAARRAGGALKRAVKREV